MIETIYRDIEREIALKKGHLLTFFQNAASTLRHMRLPAPLDLEALKYLTYASEFLYINPGSLLPCLLKKGELYSFSVLLYKLSSLDYRCAQVLLTIYPPLTVPLACMDREILLLTGQLAGRVKNGARVLDICLSYGEADTCRFMLNTMATIASCSPANVVACADILVNRLKSLPLLQIQKWLSRGTDLLTSNRIEEGLHFLKLESEESRRMLNFNHVVLYDFKNPLKIYCTSLAGKELNVSSLELSMFGLKNPYTDGSTLFLPPEIDFFEDPELNRRAYTVMAAQQAASVGMGTFQFDLDKITFKEELRDNYGTRLPEILINVRKQFKEVARSVRERADGEMEVIFNNDRKLVVQNSDHEKFFFSFPTPNFVKALFILIDNARIEYRLSQLYPGLKEDFGELNRFMWEERPGIVIAEQNRDRTAWFLGTLEALIQFSLTGKTKNRFLNRGLSSIVVQIIQEFKKIYKKEASVYDSAEVTFRVYNLFYENFPIVPYCEAQDIKEKFKGLNKPEIFPEIVLEVTPELMKYREKSPGLPQQKSNKIDLTSLRYTDKKLEQLRATLNSGEVKIFRYPEFNYMKNSYEKNHCTVFERIPEPHDEGYYDAVLASYKYVYKKIRKHFLYMKPEEMEISRRWYGGTDIHLSDGVDYTITLLRKETPDEKIYFRKIQNKRDIAVAILTDASSSTDTAIDNRKIIDIEKAALSILASALSVIDDPFGIFSFFSMGPKQVFVNVLKDFGERWDRRAQSRLPSITAYAGNRDGCAIRHISHRLEMQPEKTKLLILLSDGIPADANYGAGSASDTSQYAIEDTRRAILECRRKNIIPYCITIDRYAKKYISYLYGEHSHAILTDITALPEKLSRLYLKLTR